MPPIKPITFLDILKLSKVTALQHGLMRINMDIVSETLKTFVDTTDLPDEVAWKFGLDPKDKKAPKRKDGIQRLAESPAKPSVSLTADVSSLRNEYGANPVAGLFLPEQDTNTAPPDVADDITNNAPLPPADPAICSDNASGTVPGITPEESAQGREVTLQECLVLAGQQATASGRDTISVSSLREALALYVDTSGVGLHHAALLGITGKPAARTDGITCLAGAPAEPPLPLSNEVAALLEQFKDETLTLRLPASGAPPRATKSSETSNKHDRRNHPGHSSASGEPAPGTGKEQEAQAAEDSSTTISREERVPAALKQVDEQLQELEATIIGQPAALARLRTELLARALGLNTPDKPRLLVCVGPSGTGKSLLARKLADANDGKGLVLNMASFQSHNEGFGLTGLREGYSNAGPGRLTGFVRRHPRAVVVFDDVDRAHPNVQNILANLLSDGYLEDEYGFGNEKERSRAESRRVSFKSAQLIFTLRPSPELAEDNTLSTLIRENPAQAATLLAEDMLARRDSDDSLDSSRENGSISAYLAGYLANATILPFAELTIDSLTRIARKSLANFAELFSKQAIPVEFDNLDLISSIITLSFGPDIAPLDLAEAGTHWLTEACFADTAASSQLPERVEVSVAQEVTDWFAEHPLDALHRNQFRRREVLRYDLSPHRQDGVLKLVISAVRLERIQGRKDYGADDGFAIEIPDLRFSDIKGHTRAKERLQQIIQLFNAPAMATSAADAQQTPPPKGMLLHGRPGTGKTMLAKALAAEAGVPFISVAGPQLFNPALTRSIFSRARRYAPSIVFIDEIDALGIRGMRGMEPAINQLLAEIDGFGSRSEHPVFIIAATNFLANVDPALLRSGRLDLLMEVPLLDREARRHFIESRLCSLPHPQAGAAAAWNIDALVAMTAGMSGADFEKVYRELLLSQQQSQDGKDGHVSYEQLLEQINTVKYGERSRRKPLQEYLAAIAYHEAGHAVLAALLHPERPLEQVTIAGRGDAHGFVALSRDDEHALRPMNRNEAMNDLCVKLAGRVAQLRQFPVSESSGGSDNGAASDLAKATEMAWLAVTQWGLDESFGWLSLAPFDNPLPPAWMERAQTRVDIWLQQARERTEKLVENHWAVIAKLAEQLLQDETLDGQAVLKLIEEQKNGAA
ncbi:ATP-dependent Zn protease [Kerstersia gyiorum]|uniref:AAA family ATPase n=1 Tax=Kerstersia gyiorum TaxID=206506 RepID=UPI00209D49BE|nr:AAA family ATPase [Kerstersia gyiorum]MCP1713551.1 ATP-dependent Zn protease [Kerstersia gyiorum]